MCYNLEDVFDGKVTFEGKNNIYRFWNVIDGKSYVGITKEGTYE